MDGVKLDRYCYAAAIAFTSCVALAADLNREGQSPDGVAPMSPNAGPAGLAGKAGRPGLPGLPGHGAVLFSAEDVNQALGLVDSQLTTVGGELVAGEPVFASVNLDGVEYEMELGVHSVRSPLYDVRAQIEDGSIVMVEPGPVNTYRGVVIGVKGTEVAASIEPDGLHARIRFPDENDIWVQPLSRHIAGAGPDDYVAYRRDDVADHGGTCGVTDVHRVEGVDLLGEGEVGESGGGGGSNIRWCAEIAFDADVEMHNFNGGVSGVEARANTLINFINSPQYAADVEIKHVITTILVRTAEPDPYSSTNANSILNEFTNEWNNNQGGIQRDVATLLSGKNFDSTTIGIAWLRNICTNLSYNAIEGDFTPFACGTDLLAHELGHNWTADHCTCGGFTMNASLTCSNRFSPTETIPEIVAYRQTRVGCLDRCELVPTTLPFFDDFPSTTLDPALWTGIDAASSNNFGENEPSAPNSLNVDGDQRFGGNEARTAAMDTSALGLVRVEYFWQRKGNGESPDPGDDLVAEFQNPSGSWAEFNRHLGDGPDMTTYEFVGMDLPLNPFFGAYHTNFRVRFRSVSTGTGQDDWFVDDVRVIDNSGGAICPQSFIVDFGTHVGGDLSSLCDSDDDRLEVSQKAAITPLLPNVRVVMIGTASADTVTSLDYTLEARATALPANSPQRLEMFNYDTNSYEIVDERTATPADSVVLLNFVVDPSRFIANFTREARARVSWFNPGDVFFVNWNGEIDQAQWEFN